MKKKTFLLMLICIIGLSLCSCSNQEEGHKKAVDGAEASEENIDEEYPDIMHIRSICELATLECYYHNVAKSTKEKGKGILNIGEKERTFWIEYSGTAKIGIDVSEVKMEIKGKQIEITIPKAKLLGLSGYSFEEDNYISSDDGINKNPITAENQTQAIAIAEANIKEMLENDSALLMRAQDNAKKLIENYIKQLSQLSGTEYQIKWHYK